MVISTTGTGERPLFVSYISEVPVWKTHLSSGASRRARSPFLQGWAVVDNTIGEDWTGVELSLVAGAPQSFIQQISQPYYTDGVPPCPCRQARARDAADASTAPCAAPDDADRNSPADRR